MIRIPTLCLVLFPVASIAADDAVSFDRDIRPLLARKCFACHGPGKQEAGLRLDQADWTHDDSIVDTSNPQHRTALFTTPAAGRIDVTRSTHVRVDVQRRRRAVSDNPPD